MGMPMHVGDSVFAIKKDRFPMVLEVLKRIPRIEIPTFETWCITMKRIFRKNVGFNCVFNEDGDIIDIWFESDSMYSLQEEFFRAIAKYVEVGSYINCQTVNEWTFWQMYFNGDCMIEKRGHVVFEDSPA